MFLNSCLSITKIVLHCEKPQYDWSIFQRGRYFWLIPWLSLAYLPNRRSHNCSIKKNYAFEWILSLIDQRVNSIYWLASLKRMLSSKNSQAINCFQVKNSKRTGKIRIICPSGVYENERGYIFLNSRGNNLDLTKCLVAFRLYVSFFCLRNNLTCEYII